MEQKSLLSTERRSRVISVAVAAAVSLYFLVVFVAEPLRTLAATTASTWVQFTVTSVASITCDSTATIPSASGTSGSASSGNTILSLCTPVTNDSLGYTLSWLINVSTGTTTCVQASRTSGGCYGTGHLLSNNVTSGNPDTVRSMEQIVTGANAFKTPYRLDDTTNPSASGARWGARVSTDSTTDAGGDITWGTDGATETYAPVATGSAINIVKRFTETASTGDLEYIRWKAIIPSGLFVPTGTYKAYVTFTITNN
ncbi:hypothetical protein A3A67_05375 [Candidatus Peribacteria bacterium RIFCSPLOWO2_01_FULL_51_18]|nr:MAG: hypothetical protein A3C52_00315 [Candidatus Peribacteria bacterium RIFCSPHIGHO2_02_FULL_51_15]OGJ66359.1 MAG: hypothetical protein A3A67_05375 [Candidatus Peribacteria bacterium RIFCSPLOWO2_01_FULL_51_18]OGJ67825.1 MAG: hypothetical protein A3J34_01605 [Candidatus Peribacteria bacterium RIFCSPLOWO2_02_FULL_51_10]